MARKTKQAAAAKRPAARSGFRPAKPPYDPFPSTGNDYADILRWRIFARFGESAATTAWAIDLPIAVMIDPCGPIVHAFDRLEDLTRAGHRMASAAQRDVFLALVKEWQQGYLGRWHDVHQKQKRVGAKVAAQNRRRKAEVDADRAAAVVESYERARRRLPAGRDGDIRARQIVIDQWEQATGFPLTDRTIRNILDGAGIRRHGRRSSRS